MKDRQLDLFGVDPEPPAPAARHARPEAGDRGVVNDVSCPGEMALADAGVPRRGAGAMLALLARWQQQGWLRRIDLEFARFLAGQAGTGTARADMALQHGDTAATATTVAAVEAVEAVGAAAGPDTAETVEITGTVAAAVAAEAADAALGQVLLAAALCSWQLGRGHACLDLVALHADAAEVLSLPAEVGQVGGAMRLGDWQRACAAWPGLVHRDGPEGGAPSSSAGVCPLVLQGPRLYLHRYWRYEQQVKAAIQARLCLPGLGDGMDAGAQTRLMPVLTAGLGVLFPPAGGQPARADWQKMACALVARHRFGLITGGPGTGKTTTVVRLLALLQMLAKEAQGCFLQIGLAAPTGKAAARLNSSISGAIEKLSLAGLPGGEAIRQAIPSTVLTLHRLLRSRRGTRHFRHDARHPLPLDVLVIDEASMVDLDMMAAVVQALPADARLVLLGDKDQLASVEAGAILGELCAQAQEGHYWPETAAWVTQVTGERIDAGLQDADGRLLDQGIAMLRHSHRFRADSGIGRLAAHVNAGEAEAVRGLWQQPGAQADIRRIIVADEARRGLRQLVIAGWGQVVSPARAWPDASRRGNPDTAGGADDAVDTSRSAETADQDHGAGAAMGYAHYLQVLLRARPEVSGLEAPAMDAALDAWAQQVLAAHGRFQLLAALRQGPWGVEQLNRQMAQWLQQQGLIESSEGWYEGRPVMVTQNDYELQLMNGDVGIALMRPGLGLRVAFAGEPGAAPIRWVLPSRLQAVETVFAMTVHKAQGSEFDHAALAVPAELSPVLTRELVYTAITRARRFFTLCGPGSLEAVFEAAIRRRVLRASGLVAGMGRMAN